MNPWLQRLVVAAFVIPAAWWLFSDTVKHYSASAADPDTIRFAHFGSYQDYELWRRIIDAFEAANPTVRVQQEYVPGWYGRYDSKIRQQILSGTLPHVVMMQLGPFTGVAEHFAVLDPFIANDQDALDVATELDLTAVRAFSVPAASGGLTQLRGLPIAGGDLLIYCNPRCFEAAGRLLSGRSAGYGAALPLPDDDWTMDEFTALARRLTCDFDGDGQLDQFGFWLPRWIYYLPFLWSFGSQVVDETQSRWTLTDRHARDALTFYRDLITTWKVCPQPGDVPQLIQDVAFLTGRVAMCVNGPWFQPFLEQTRLRDSYHIVHIPRGPGGRATRVTWDGLCIAENLSPSEKETAWKLVRFCVSQAVQNMIAESGRSIPALRKSLHRFDRNATDQRRRKFIEALSYASLQPRIPRFSEVDRVIERHLQRFIAADSLTTPEQLLTNLARNPVIVDVFQHKSDRLP